MKIRFLGGCRQVTGSSHLLEAGGLKLLIDCGLYQERAFLERNWNPFPVSPETIDYVLLTHAHLDHSGLIPKLVREGFSRKILATPPSVDLVPIMLMDSARIHEEDAAFKKKRHEREGRRGPHPEIPLYTAEEAGKVFPLLESIPYGKPVSLGKNVTLEAHDAGHILGSSMLELLVRENGRERKFIFSGDIGQWDKPLIRDPEVFDRADYVVMESTYGDRTHDDPEDVESLLCRIINETVEAGGNVVIPTFAVERAQEFMFYLSKLVREDRIPHLLVFLDSPMAVDVTAVFLQHPESLDKETRGLLRSGDVPFRFPGLKIVRTSDESKAINRIKGSCIIMAGSGMCTGGRIKHHLVQNISRPESTVLFVGYQAKGTLGRQIIEGHPEVRIFGRNHQVRARISQIHGFSGHADRDDLLRWLGAFKEPPSTVFMIHGDEEVSQKFAETVGGKRGWKTAVPGYGEEIELA